MGERNQIYEIEDLKAGDHLCCLYKNDKEHRTILTAYMRQGLERNEKVFYIVDTHTSETVLDYLRDDGLEVEPYLNSGQLMILTVNQSYMEGGVFDPDSMIHMLSHETEIALQEGYSALRVTGEMSWVLKGLPGSERLIEYEAKLNEFFPNNKALAICQYDQRLFEPELLLNILLTHPIVVIGTKIYENFYYMPPEKYPFDIPESTLNEWIKSLEVYHDAKGNIKQGEEVLRAILESFKDSIALVNDSGIFLEVNKATAERFGVNPEDMIGTNIKDYISPDLFKSRWKYFEKVFRTKEPVEFEDERDGLFFFLSINPVFEHDQVKKVAVFAQDITKRKKSENDLKEAHSKLEATLKAIPDLMFEVGSNGRIYDYYAPKSENLYVNPDVFMGKKVNEVLPKEVALKVLEALTKQTRRDGVKGLHTHWIFPPGKKSSNFP